MGDGEQVIWWRTQFDKCLLVFVFILGAAGATFFSSNERVSDWFRGAGGGALASLLTLVTARRGANNELFPPEATSSTTTANVTTVSKTEPSEPKP